MKRSLLAPNSDRWVGWRDLTIWRTPAGRALVAAARWAARQLGPHTALLLTLAIGGLLTIGLTAASAEIYEAVVDEEGIAGFDRPVLDTARDLRTPTLERIVTGYTDIGSQVPMTILAIVAVLCLAAWWRQWTPIVLMAIAGTGSVVMTIVGKAVVGRIRPPLSDAVAPYESSGSFPSGHSLNSVVIAGLVAYLLVAHQRSARARTATVLAAAAFAVAMGLSRVYLGHHWLTDVIVAWTLGLGWLTAVITGHRLYLTVWQRRQAPQPSAL